jgi:plastocyanin
MFTCRPSRIILIILRSTLTIVLILTLSGFALAVTPGVDIAVPKVTVVTIASALVFVPSMSVVEQGDYVQWKNNGLGSHTTTSGNPCVASGLWNGPLGAGALFERRFPETAGTIPYFCSPHCLMSMTGNVRVTTPIVVQASENAGTLTFSWTGGGPTYQVFRSSTPGFVGSTPTPPAGGDTGTSISDSSALNPGVVNYYLVMNK